MFLPENKRPFPEHTARAARTARSARTTQITRFMQAVKMKTIANSAREYRLLLTLLSIFLIVIAGVVFPDSNTLFIAGALLPLIALALLLLYYDYIRPQNRMEDLMFNLRAGSLHKRLLCGDKAGGFHHLCGELNFVAEMLESQSLRVTEQLQKHISHMEDKNRLLITLYHFTDALSTALSLSDFTTQMMKGLEDGFDIRRVIIRLNMPDGMRLLASAGDFNEDEGGDCLPVDSPWLKTSGKSCRMAIPVDHHGRLLGICCMYLDKQTFRRRDELNDLFTSMGRYLAIAIERRVHKKEEQRLSIMDEREKIAHELHDSLAQTIHSIGHCAHAIENSVKEERDLTQIRGWLERLLTSANEANREVRTLIAQFRSDGEMHEAGSVAELIERMQRQYPPVKIHFYKSWGDDHLPVEYEICIYKIVQEALSNVFKHSGADMVRVLMRHDDGKYRVLIEDNGAGMDVKKADSRLPGEHVGFSAMYGRTKNIGGKLSIDSEPGEGVRLLLCFTYPNES